MEYLQTFLIILLSVCIIPSSLAEIRYSQMRSDSRPMISFHEFGFTERGHLEMYVTKASYKLTVNKEINPVHVGFFVTTSDAWFHVLQQLEEEKIKCILDSNRVTVLFTFEVIQKNKNFYQIFSPSNPNQYILIFLNCIADLQVSMTMKFVMYNLEGESDIKDYLPTGQTVLPSLYFGFFVIYATLAGVWSYVCVKNIGSTHRIQILMGALVCLKAVILLCEAEDRFFIKRTGTAHGWDVVFYIFNFFKGIMLFTLIILIGTGWSFLRPYLQEKDKRVLMLVIPLQVFANIVAAMIGMSGPSTKDWFEWKQLFLLIDIVCRGVVLFPIAWSIKHLKEATQTDGKAAIVLRKLTLFRHYYIVVICYVYLTRVFVFSMLTRISFRYIWTSDLTRECATLAFYVFTGYKLRPVMHNPYLTIEEEEEAKSQALNMDNGASEL